MKQTLNVNLNIQIPEDYVLIKKVELEELERERLLGVYWSMKDLEERTGMKRQWIQANILYNPKFKDELKEFVFYPRSQGEKWAFHALKMTEFLDKNFRRIFGE